MAVCGTLSSVSGTEIIVSPFGPCAKERGTGSGSADQLQTRQLVPQKERRGTTSSSDRLSPPDPKGSGPSALCLKAWEIPYECKLDLPHPPTDR